MSKLKHVVRWLMGLPFIVCLLWLPFSTTRAQKVGLVLGGGGAKGAAEVGVMKVLEECGVHVDCVAGTSIGAIVGALYAAGYSPQELDSMFRQQEWVPLLTDYRDDLWATPYRRVGSTHYVFGFPVYDSEHFGFGVLHANKVENYLRDMLKARGCQRFQDLKIPFYCVATDLFKAEAVVFSEGDVTPAVHASMAIPAIFKTVEIDGRTLVDGGAVNNLPIDVLRERENPDIIIAIDLTQSKPDEWTTDDSALRDVIPYINWVAQLVGLGNITEWLFTQPQVGRYRANVASLADGVDIYINPSLGDYSYASFSKEKIERMLVIGEQTARHPQMLKRLCELAQQQRERRHVNPMKRIIERVRKELLNRLHH